MNRKDYKFLVNMDLSKFNTKDKEEIYWLTWCKIKNYVEEKYSGHPIVAKIRRRNEMMIKSQIKYARRKK